MLTDDIRTPSAAAQRAPPLSAQTVMAKMLFSEELLGGPTEYSISTCYDFLPNFSVFLLSLAPLALLATASYPSYPAVRMRMGRTAPGPIRLQN